MAKRKKGQPRVVKVKDDWKHEVKQKQNYICPICGRKCNDHTMNIHHKQPKAKKGSNYEGNTVGWCLWCHRAYHKRYGLRTSDDYGNPI